MSRDSNSQIGTDHIEGMKGNVMRTGRACTVVVRIIFGDRRVAWLARWGPRLFFGFGGIGRLIALLFLGVFTDYGGQWEPRGGFWFM